MGDALLAWRNVWRNPRRSMLTVLAITFATALLVFMLSFQFGSYEDMINSSVRLRTGHLQVQAPGYNDRQEMRRVVEAPGQLLPLIRRQPGVVDIGIRSESFALAAGEHRSRGAMVVGADPLAEHSLSSLPGQMEQGRFLQPGDSGVALIGSLCARRLGIGPGDECTLLGQGKDGSVAATVVRIVGIFRSGIDAFDRSTLYIPLQDFDEVFYMEGAAHRIVVTVERLNQVRPLITALHNEPAFQGLAILGWEELAPGLRQSIELDLISGIIMYLILVIVVAFSILNTFFMAIFERTREFGVLMAIGTRPKRLVNLMLLESMAMTLLGLLSGMLIGSLLTLYFSQYGISFGESGELLAQYGVSERLYPRLSALSLLTGPGIILVITFITALIPAMKIPRLSPTAAMRSC